ncbi:hemerythrin [Psychrobacter sp. YP14]|uniref:hemerythrin domain-containing protein n=1 Tax=Psychrobacter sp. YP14 TaxID=2203895 RepID=UPI000D7E775A|nr:hemerythrin domain-containing protein [Psychrobacter sp. YP14]AWT49898.1 hemerythrin [Psychrobacter sp. YP14]
MGINNSQIAGQPQATVGSTDDNAKVEVKPRHPESRLQSDWLFLYEKLPSNQWYSSDYAYKTSGWLNVHTNIRKRQRILRQLSEEYLMGALNWENYRSQILQRIGIHVLKLHQHHSVEDHGFFPDFVSSYPQLKAGFEILEKDHVKLNALLDELQGLNDELAKANIEDKALADRLHQNLITGTDFLSQHLTDEEDLVIPILGLRWG